jgi:hypothetical protein
VQHAVVFALAIVLSIRAGVSQFPPVTPTKLGLVKFFSSDFSGAVALVSATVAAGD